MSELRFRAWDKNKMHYSDDYNNLEHFFAHFDGDFNTSILMQFTGLKDKNGKEIWEGDIVKSYFYKEEISEIKFGRCGVNIGEYPAHGFYYTCDDHREILCLGDCLNEIEIIGNAYENPELSSKILNSKSVQEESK